MEFIWVRALKKTNIKTDIKCDRKNKNLKNKYLTNFLKINKNLSQKEDNMKE